MTYQPIPREVAGGKTRVPTVDDETRELMRLLVAELRIMNLHLTVMTDNNFDLSDVEA